MKAIIILAIAFATALLLSGCASQLPPGLPPAPPGNDSPPPPPPDGGQPPTIDAPNVPGTGPEPIACTADAKICPDGTAVGRVGPDCEFAPCPKHEAAAIPDIAGFPEKYANRSLAVEGVVRLEGSLFGGDAAFYLDGGNASVQTDSWAPFTVAACPAGTSQCNPPETMPYYIGKKVIARGKLALIGGRYVLTVENAEVVSETAGMARELCESARGYWNGCASACRGAPAGTACTLQCVQQCECGGIAGFGCPQGHQCTDYLPAGATDAMGVCRKI